MHKSATKCNETIGKWCENKHGASKIIDTFETYQLAQQQAFSSVKKPRHVDQERSKQMTEGDAASLRQLRTIYRVPRPSFALLAATRTLHTTQPNTLFPTCDEVVNLTGLLETKGMSISTGKQ
jgi:hypothetical protein